MYTSILAPPLLGPTDEFSPRKTCTAEPRPMTALSRATSTLHAWETCMRDTVICRLFICRLRLRASREHDCRWIPKQISLSWSRKTLFLMLWWCRLSTSPTQYISRWLYISCHIGSSLSMSGFLRSGEDSMYVRTNVYTTSGHIDMASTRQCRCHSCLPTSTI